MKTLFNIAFSAVVALAAIFMAGCDNQEDMFTKQQEGIVRYLESTRRLVAEEKVDEVIEEQPAFYTAFGRELYRHIVNYYDEGRDAKAEVKQGSTLEITFNAYVFNNSEPTLTSCYWSNDPTTIGSLEKNGNKLDWSTEPLQITIGSTHIIDGLKRGLTGCREGDQVQLYMTYKMAYGKQLVGTVPKYSAVAWYINILSVK